jgi:hypothetical protein
MSPDTVEKIKSKGYWRVVIRPTADFYKEDRFKIDELFDLVENNQTRLRGWYYPHTDRDDFAIVGKNKIRNKCDFETHIEHWEFMTSGQFVHLFAMSEDYFIDEAAAEKIRNRFDFNLDKAKGIEKFLNLVSTTYKFTEIYLFASNLAQLKAYKDVEAFEITIELYDIKDRMLYIGSFSRELWSPYVSQIEDGKISFTGEYSKEELIAKFDTYALDNILETFKLFGWPDPNVQAIQGDQDNLIKRKL